MRFAFGFFLFLALASGLVDGIQAAASVESTAAIPSPREVTDLSEGWRFRFGADEAGVTTSGYDDQAWEQVSVPHSWNRVGEYSLTRSTATNNKQGVGWYRLTFNAPPAAKGKRQYFDFAAVGNIADVWVNGQHVGQHKGAFSRFRFDVTAQWKPNAANLIVVKADNSKPAIGSSTADVIPLAGDFFIHGGMYRGVSLVTANDVGIDLLDYGSPGVYAHATAITPVKAEVEVLTRLRNSSKSRNLTATAIIRDADNKPVATAAQRLNLSKGTSEARQSLVVSNPHLWNGRTDPYLYSVTVEIRDRQKLIDRVTQPLGIRSFKFDANEGFSLNGQYLKLHGVSRHQDRAGKGYALSREDHAEDMALIKEIGANTVRQAHYQHADEWSDEADKAGMVVWAEVPYVTTPSFNGSAGSEAIFSNAEQQARELIRQNYNHPSIMMWSVGNEVDAGAMFGVSKTPSPGLKLLQHINKIAKEEDLTRPTTFADCCEGQGGGRTAGENLTVAADMVGYNRYFGWYYPQPHNARAQLGSEMDKLHAKHPALPISISEYGAGGAVTQHSDNPLGGAVNFVGRPHPEEYLSWYHEANWLVIRDRKFVFASWVWNMFDFASDLREEGDAVDINNKGLVTFDRKIKKDAFFYYKANWSAEPTLHLTGKRYVDRPYPAIEVRAYSNADKATLRLNGKMVGEAPCPERICVWPNVVLQQGANEALVTASVKGETVSDTARWTGPDTSQGIRIEAGDLSGRLLGDRRFGSDTYFTGGETALLNLGGFGGRRSATLRTVTALNSALYDNWREGDAFGYAIPVPDGKWTVIVHSFEPREKDTEKQAMTISAQGKLVVPAFNIGKTAGGSLKGMTKSFAVTVKGGVLKLEFASKGGKAVVAAIEVTK